MKTNRRKDHPRLVISREASTPEKGFSEQGRKIYRNLFDCPKNIHIGHRGLITTQKTLPYNVKYQWYHIGKGRLPSILQLFSILAACLIARSPFTPTISSPAGINIMNYNDNPDQLGIMKHLLLLFSNSSQLGFSGSGFPTDVKWVGKSD